MAAWNTPPSNPREVRGKNIAGQMKSTSGKQNTCLRLPFESMSVPRTSCTRILFAYRGTDMQLYENGSLKKSTTLWTTTFSNHPYPANHRPKPGGPATAPAADYFRALPNDAQEALGRTVGWWGWYGGCGYHFSNKGNVHYACCNHIRLKANKTRRNLVWF